ncbi:hypothetical protein GCM10027277_49130 [Pseudoduganella ginsengisoli]|uniref:Uncharacterized protein n=1 Tax=Pseudoduganella ginsengisoli TaxID=1462440 RepID=A0A6L6Q566_9BURK|nr:hypothetical protein [Pseudoduganella ginsengisoli]MTW04534.1 hypothetical protein [Pseudoduganella ginsengisoli]
MKIMSGLFLLLVYFFSVPVWAEADISTDEVLEIIRQDAKSAFGDMREDIYLPNVKVSSALVELIGPSIAGKPENFGNYIMVYGCRVQSCTEKAVAIVDGAKKRIAAVGLINFRCGRKQARDSAGKVKSMGFCEKNAVLNTYVLVGDDEVAGKADLELLVKKIHQWAAMHYYEGEVFRRIKRR